MDPRWVVARSCPMAGPRGQTRHKGPSFRTFSGSQWANITSLATVPRRTRGPQSSFFPAPHRSPIQTRRLHVATSSFISRVTRHHRARNRASRGESPHGARARGEHVNDHEMPDVAVTDLVPCSALHSTLPPWPTGRTGSSVSPLSKDARLSACGSHADQSEEVSRRCG